MNAVDKLAIVLTCVSIFVTVISIVCSIISSRSAKKANEYKEEILRMSDTLNLEGFTSKFETESNHFLDKTRPRDWYRGVEVNAIISPFKSVIISFGQYYHLITEADALRCKVHELNSIVDHYDMATGEQKRKVVDQILEITEILQDEVRRNKEGILGLSCNHKRIERGPSSPQ